MNSQPWNTVNNLIRFKIQKVYESKIFEIKRSMKFQRSTR